MNAFIKILEVRENAVQVEQLEGGPLLVAKYTDADGEYFYNDQLVKQYVDEFVETQVDPYEGYSYEERRDAIAADAEDEESGKGTYFYTTSYYDRYGDVYMGTRKIKAPDADTAWDRLERCYPHGLMDAELDKFRAD